jgi:hypothetical protein
MMDITRNTPMGASSPVFGESVLVGTIFAGAMVME